MSNKRNLFKSNDGIELVPDVCLKIAEALVTSDPKAIGPLLLTSKSLYSLLKKYEKSITKSVSVGNMNFYQAAIKQKEVVPSRVLPGYLDVVPHSYPWLLEMKTRSCTIEKLISHDITSMADLTGSWPVLDVPEAELSQRREVFKRESLLLLYRLADCAVGLEFTSEIRKAQSVFFETLSTTDLACLGCIVEVIGQGFFNITKTAFMKSRIGQNLLSRAPIDHPASVFIPSSASFDDLTNDNWIRECMCVFEDLVQQHGPFFAWACLEDFETVTKGTEIWTYDELQQGLDNMNAFELGYTMSYASLQSVVWKVFCKRTGCSLQKSWAAAKALVEEQMADYRLKGTPA